MAQELEEEEEHAVHNYNPLSHSITQLYEPTNEVPTLFSLCLTCARRHITLRNFPRIKNEHLPFTLAAELSYLRMTDFHINPAHVTGEHHVEKIFPARCLIDNSKTHVCLSLSGNNKTILNDPAYITTFRAENVFVYVLEYTDNLDQYFEKLREFGETLSEESIWKVLFEIAKSVLDSSMDVLHPSRLRIINDKVFCRQPFNLATGSIASHMTRVIAGTRAGIYEAPETLERKRPYPETASWTVGCIAYELATLVPAFYDREGSGNMMKVISDVMQAVPPPDIPDSHSCDLKNLIKKCLKREPNMRPLITDIKKLASEHIFEEL